MTASLRHHHDRFAADPDEDLAERLDYLDRLHDFAGAGGAHVGSNPPPVACAPPASVEGGG